MFTLADKHSFEPEAGRCCLYAYSGYASDFSWELYLSSQVAVTDFEGESVRWSFTISINPQLGERNWRELPGLSMELTGEELRGGFQLYHDSSSEWEDLVSLHLRFGEIRGSTIEVLATGIGSVEHAPDVFPDGEVDFHIRTWVTFRGVSINVPLNARNPVEYATMQIKSKMPGYEFSTPAVRDTSVDDGAIRIIEVHLAPA